MRSAEAAKSTAQLIEQSVQNAESGVVLTTEVLENLEEINGQSATVSEVMDEIMMAGEQQSTGLDQINTAVEQMNQSTQQTAASAEESSGASEELNAQADKLLSLVSEYQLSNASIGGRRAVDGAGVAVAIASGNVHAAGNGAAVESRRRRPQRPTESLESR